MKTQLEFKSSAFPAYEDESEQINPDRWGMRLAEYLHSELPAHGFTPEGDPFYEDWGVCICLKNDAFPLMLGCGNQDDDEYLVFLEPSKAEIKKGLFRKKVIDTTSVLIPLAEAVESIIRAHPETKDLQWQ
ncbi:hypothetical protein NT6N_22770 [Oceaniferula spumae]|uniref:DUF1801 domain-containing protein n=1 Tax=Oceaniferula spumae TaxID=2979115 RepID=A0AAT9FM83_9BACT